MKRHRALASLFLMATLSACVAATGGPRSGSPSPGSPSVDPSGGAGSGGSVGGDTPVEGPSLEPVPSGRDPIFPGEPQLLLPHPGHVNLHPVSVMRLDVPPGRHGVVRASWWSGIEPCTGLDSVLVKRDGGTIWITVREGTPPDAGNIACIDIAVFKATIVDLGTLAKGTYTVRTTSGAAPPIRVTIG
jgi:hypothetical protein